jgi:hypothetical protein
MSMSEGQVETLEYIFDRIKQGTADVMTEWEREFISDQQTRYEAYSNETRFSDKQWAIIERIEAALIEGKRSRR